MKLTRFTFLRRKNKAKAVFSGRTRMLAGSVALFAAALMPSHQASATPLFWDTNAATAGSGAATGTWGTNTFWSTDPAGNIVPTITITGNTDDVTFSAGTPTAGGTVTISGAQVASSITFDDNFALTLSGGTSITIGGTGASQGIFVGAADNAANAISTALILANTTSTIQNAGAGVLAFSGGITGAQALVLRNNGATANGITISTVSLNNAGTVTNSGSGVGNTLISAVVGSSVTGVVQNSATSQFTLNNAANTFTSAVTITSGQLNAASVTGFGSIAATTTLTLGGASTLGILNYSGAASSSTRQITVLAGGGQINSTTGTLTFAPATALPIITASGPLT